MREMVGLDFETYGAVDLKRHGMPRYVGDKSFMPLIGSVANVNEPTYRMDFVHEPAYSKQVLRERLDNRYIVAHNAPFEQAVLSHLGLDYPSHRFIDSAVIARAAGAGGHLEAAAAQLLKTDKVAAGAALMKLFSVRGKYQEALGSELFDPQVILDHPQEWVDFGHYCDVDAELGLTLARLYLSWLTQSERDFNAVTLDMNNTGWCVDVPLVEEMQRRYLENQEVALFEFREKHSAHTLNLNSLQQMRAWCLERGIKARSFDEKHVASLLTRIEAKLESGTVPAAKLGGYEDVADLLRTKQILGGSSLKKLQVILDTAVEDPWNPGRHRLRDQYLHCGAGQTLRTTGRSTQMQNLKRLGAEPADMDELLSDTGAEWDNTKLALNLRQVFTATDPNGRLIVGDFKSVESRGLAWLAGASSKLAAFRAGKDMYKVMAASPEMFGVPYDLVTKEQRQAGKVGELSCGYGAGAEAVTAFAANMGVPMTEAEAGRIVTGWRLANPSIVSLWAKLDEMLHVLLETGSSYEYHPLADGLTLKFARTTTPDSLLKQHPRAQSVEMSIVNNEGIKVMVRYFHGCYVRGRNVCYYKPSTRKTGQLWQAKFTDPKTKMLRFYELYGGKLAGILTQSFCRELFFGALMEVDIRVKATNGQVKLVGQFHDEIVLDWKPGAISLEEMKAQLGQAMSTTGLAPSFPLDADVKSDYRYTK